MDAAMKFLRFIFPVLTFLSLYACTMVDSATKELMPREESAAPRVYYAGVADLKMFSESRDFRFAHRQNCRFMRKCSVTSWKTVLPMSKVVRTGQKWAGFEMRISFGESVKLPRRAPRSVSTASEKG